MLAGTGPQRGLREILAAKLVAGEEVDGQIFEITDENNVVRATFPLRDVLSLK